MDEFNASVEGNFTIVLLDVYEPYEPNHFVDLNSSADLEMIWVEPGTFIMGSPDTEVGGSRIVKMNTMSHLQEVFILVNMRLLKPSIAVMYGNSFNLSSSQADGEIILIDQLRKFHGMMLRPFYLFLTLRN